MELTKNLKNGQFVQAWAGVNGAIRTRISTEVLLVYT